MHIYFIIDKQKSIVYKSKYLFVPILNEQGHHLNVNRELMEMKRHSYNLSKVPDTLSANWSIEGESWRIFYVMCVLHKGQVVK